MSGARPDLEAYRVELTGYCYRMLGSPFDAEDAVQETLVRAWRALDRFEGRSALRSWLFGIATNVCIDALNARRRRAMPMDLGPSSGPGAPLGTPLPAERWVMPVPDALVLDPAEETAARDSIRLAFVATLQHLNPRQRAVLILRDVLRWKAAEVAELLECSTTSVNSLLRRARDVIAAAGSTTAMPDEEARALVDRYADAFARYDVDAIVALLHDEVVLSMPPFPLWLRGIEAVRGFLETTGVECRSARLVPVTANGSPAFASYRPTGPDGRMEPFAIVTIETSDGAINGMHTFIDPALFPLFDVPLDLAA